jgi:FkbM family methyltransferase
MPIAVPRSSSGAPLYYAGWSEPDESAFMESVVRAGRVVFDVGAHVGEYTLLAAARGAVVHAFEANPSSAALLRANIARNGLATVTVHEVAASDREGEETLLARGDLSLSALWNEQQADEGYERVVVPTRRIDSIAAPPPDVIKLDVEGAELAALRGAEGTLERHGPLVVFEVVPANYARFGYGPNDVIELLVGHGYDLRFLDGTAFESWPDGLESGNLVASRRPTA